MKKIKNMNKEIKNVEALSGAHTYGGILQRGRTVQTAKLGDTVYVACLLDDDDEGSVDEMTLLGVGKDCFFVNAYVFPTADDPGVKMPIDLVGKEVFFTRWEAERVLDRMRRERSDENN